ncbi:hypothetical protein IEQ34_004791 [Dendrobium chrysotoxum]|uniref:Uncharacterized protein n=1 Tax=Dendrobium chrysotoxum TaxID=161865 RepID=A0AAV7HB34_DENCH|nr:hypothetical protein IEQ34_004791 [Dendrobium chrysotoxum]
MKWSMKCQPIMYDGSFFLKGKQYMSPEATLQTIELGIRKRKHMRLALDSIRENGAPGVVKEELHKEAQQLFLWLVEYESFAPENDVDIDYNRDMEGLDGELTWFNARLGYGISLGVGIGVGLLVRMYKAATKNFRSSFFDNNKFRNNVKNR